MPSHDTAAAPRRAAPRLCSSSSAEIVAGRYTGGAR
jgi:hypothetical protein